MFFDITLDNEDISLTLGLEIVVSATAAATAARVHKKFKFVIMQAVDHNLWFVLLVSFSLRILFFFPSYSFSLSVCEQHLAALCFEK